MSDSPFALLTAGVGAGPDKEARVATDIWAPSGAVTKHTNYLDTTAIGLLF